jgi:hypothetical protein
MSMRNKTQEFTVQFNSPNSYHPYMMHPLLIMISGPSGCLALQLLSPAWCPTLCYFILYRAS